MTLPARLTPTPAMSNREQLMLAAIRQHFAAAGLPPSYRELAARVGIEPKHVGAVLAKLARRGLLTFRCGSPRSIALADRTAMLSDAELLAAVRARGLLKEGTECGMGGAARLPHCRTEGIEG